MQQKNAQSDGAKTTTSQKWWSSCLQMMKGKMMVMMTATHSQQPSPLEPQPWSICPSLEALPLPTFICCLVTGDLSGLTTTGTPPAEALESAWLRLYSEYCDRIGGIQIASLIQRMRAVNTLSSKIDRVTMLVNAARMVWCDELTSAIGAEPTLKINAARLAAAPDTDSYLRELDAVMAKLRPDKMKLDTLVKDLPKAGSQQATERDFTRNLREVSHLEGYPVRARDITTAEYCEYICALNEHIEQLIKSKRNGGRTHK